MGGRYRGWTALMMLGCEKELLWAAELAEEQAKY